MKKEFTAGPWYLNTTTISNNPIGWEVVGRDHGSANPIIVGMMKAIAPEKTISDNYLDACLISASLELYESLKNAIESCADHDPEWLEDAIYAIKKAEGAMTINRYDEYR